jgi:DNA-binding MarR family transcriptional regulator
MMKLLDDTTAQAVRQTLAVTELLRAEYAEMTITQAVVFLFTATHGPISQIETAQRLDMTSSSVSRAVAVLSDLPNGLGLLTWINHPTDRRAKLTTITQKGIALANRIAR